MVSGENKGGHGPGLPLIILHIGLLTLVLWAAAFLLVVGFLGPRVGSPLYGEAVEENVVTWLSLGPGFVLFGLLTVAPYRRFGSRMTRGRLALFHLGEVTLAVALVMGAIALWRQVGA